MSSSPDKPPTRDSRTPDFVRLLGEHDGRLHAYILSLVPNWADAHELAQEVRLRLWEQFDQYDASGDFGAWARTIAYYKVLAYRKTSARQSARLSAEFVESIAQDSPPSAEASQARHHALLACLEKLAVQQRQLLMRYYAGNQSMKEIAAETGRSFDALRQSVLRLRKVLSRCIQGRLAAEERP